MLYFKNITQIKKYFCLNPRIFLFSCIFLISHIACSSSPEIKVAEGVVEENLKKIAGVTSRDISRVLKKEKFNLDDLYILAIERTERIALKSEMISQTKAGKNRAMAGFLPTLSYVYNKFYSIPRKGDDPTTVENYRTLQAIDKGDALYFAPDNSTSTLPPTVEAASRLLLSFPITAGFSSYQDYKQFSLLEEQRQLEAKLTASQTRRNAKIEIENSN
ncbi:MAG: hypothetical protein SH817_18710 [Leptospira sp.]|nr:hypothetical protein [Leptospira sp.]